MYSNLEKLAYQRQLIGAGIGAVTGGGAGYLGSSRDADEDEGRFQSRRLRNTLIGSALGGALGGGIGHMTRARPAAAPAAAPATARAPAIATAEKSMPTMPSSGSIVMGEGGAVRGAAAPPAPQVIATGTAHASPHAASPDAVAHAQTADQGMDATLKSIDDFMAKFQNAPPPLVAEMNELRSALADIDPATRGTYYNRVREMIESAERSLRA